MAQRDPHYARTPGIGRTWDFTFAVPTGDLDFSGTKVSAALFDTDTQAKIAATCDDIKELLLSKNRQYGDSALNPVRIMSKADPVEQLKVRIDDKLSRLARGDDSMESDDEILNDLIGYFILLKVARDADS